MKAIDFGCSPGNQGVKRDVTSTPLEIVNGVIPVPSAPGLGIEPDQI